MIGRSSTFALAEAYTHRFTNMSSDRGGQFRIVRRDDLYDFLYQEEYEAWFCNLARNNFKERDLKDWILQIHTGESLIKSTKEWTWEQRKKLGQRLLFDLSQDHLRWFEKIRNESWFGQNYHRNANALTRNLELDGYKFSDNALLKPSEDVLNVEQERELISELYKRCGLGKQEIAFQFIQLSESHFIEGRWSDSISNARKFFELTLQEGAKLLGSVKNNSLSEAQLSRPSEVRKFLENERLIELKEREALDKIYGLLSETGAHPYMAESDQARLLRQLTLTLSQFILLRLRSAMSPPTTNP